MAFPGLAYLATLSANAQADLVRGNYLIGAEIHVKSDRAKNFPTAVLTDASRTSVIGESGNLLYVLYQPPPAKSHPRVIPDGQVFGISSDAVDFVDYDIVAEGQ